MCSVCWYKIDLKRKIYETKDANPYYPECTHEQCYTQMNPFLHEPIVYYCPEHEPIVIAPPPKEHANKADKDTAYAFTLTIPTGSQPVKPLTEVAKLIMVNGLTNKPYEKATQWAYVLEHTDAGTPHIHGMYKTNSGRRIASKYFQRYHQIKGVSGPFWEEKVHLGHGHKGGYHQKARHNESYEAYMQKEGEVFSSSKV